MSPFDLRQIRTQNAYLYRSIHAHSVYGALVINVRYCGSGVCDECWNPPDGMRAAFAKCQGRIALASRGLCNMFAASY
jgi:hypothetical protein